MGGSLLDKDQLRSGVRSGAVSRAEQMQEGAGQRGQRGAGRLDTHQSMYSRPLAGMLEAGWSHSGWGWVDGAVHLLHMAILPAQSMLSS